MKASVWNIVSVASLVGTVFVVVIFLIIFLMPNQVLPTSLRPIEVPNALVLPSPTETQFQFPPTWTKSPVPVTPSDTPIPPTSTQQPSVSPTISTSAEYVLPSESPTPSASPTKTSTITKTFSASKVVIVQGTAYTFTKTKKPTKTNTPAPTRTPGGVPDFGAVDDFATVAPYPASVLINVLENDHNVSGTELHIVTISNDPEHGDVDVRTSTTIWYRPKPGFLGTDSFEYKMTNVGGLTSNAWVTIWVMDGSNTIPVAITPDSFTFDENRAAGLTIGTLDTIDDSSGPFYYILTNGTGDTNNDVVTLSTAGVVKSKAVYDREISTVYTFRVRSTDPGGLFVEQVIYLYINNVNEAPTIASAGTLSGTLGTVFSYTFNVTDPDAGDTATISIDPIGNLPPGLNFVDNGNKTATISGTPTTVGEYTFNIHAVDAGGLEAVKAMKITIGS